MISKRTKTRDPISRDGPVIQIFANPTSGSFDRGTLDSFLTELQSRGVRTIMSWSTPGQYLVIDDEATAACAFGGDGTTRHVAEAVSACGRTVPLSVFPAGTVNLLAREMVGRTGRADTANLPDAGLKSHYGAKINSALFMVCASVGPDSRAVAIVSSRLKRVIGRSAYALSFLGQWRRWPRETMTLSWDGGEIVCEAFYVAKGRYYAGPWSFAPHARVTDPLLHVVALLRADRRRYLKFMWAVMMNKVEEDANLIRFTCTALDIKAENAAPVQADGDIITYLPATINVCPQPMPFFDITAAHGRNI